MPIANAKNAPTRLIGHRIIRKFEDRILMERWRVDAAPPMAFDIADEVSQILFSNTYNDVVYLLFPEMREFSQEQIWQLRDEHECKFETGALSDDKIVEFFLPLGLDFRDEYNQPLRCTYFLARQAEAAWKGIAGTVPSKSDIDLLAWEERIEREVRGFQKRRREPRAS